MGLNLYRPTIRSIPKDRRSSYYPVRQSGRKGGDQRTGKLATPRTQSNEVIGQALGKTVTMFSVNFYLLGTCRQGKKRVEGSIINFVHICGWGPAFHLASSGRRNKAAAGIA